MDKKEHNTEQKITRKSFIRRIYIWILLFLAPSSYGVYKLFERPKFIPHSKRNTYYDPNLVYAEVPLSKLKENSSAYTILDGEKILLIRRNNSEILAYSAVCTHKNCTVQYRKEVSDIFCDCHESSFNLNGTPVNGPAREPLPNYHARIEGDKVIVTFL